MMREISEIVIDEKWRRHFYSDIDSHAEFQAI